MKIDDRRKVIEVLLCCGDPDEEDCIGSMLCDSGELEFFEAASESRKQVSRDRCGEGGMSVSEDDYNGDCLEAAYRLIESSPTLRREWFGTR